MQKLAAQKLQTAVLIAICSTFYSSNNL